MHTSARLHFHVYVGTRILLQSGCCWVCYVLNLGKEKEGVVRKELLYVVHIV